LIKVDWLAALIALKVVGAALVFFLRCWRKICTMLHPMGSNQRNDPKPADLKETRKTWTKYLPVHAENIIKPT
jgi:hypothetical protein